MFITIDYILMFFDVFTIFLLKRVFALTVFWHFITWFIDTLPSNETVSFWSFDYRVSKISKLAVIPWKLQFQCLGHPVWPKPFTKCKTQKMMYKYFNSKKYLTCLSSNYYNSLTISHHNWCTFVTLINYFLIFSLISAVVWLVLQKICPLIQMRHLYNLWLNPHYQIVWSSNPGSNQEI